MTFWRKLHDKVVMRDLDTCTFGQLKSIISQKSGIPRHCITFFPFMPVELSDADPIRHLNGTHIRVGFHIPEIDEIFIQLIFHSRNPFKNGDISYGNGPSGSEHASDYGYKEYTLQKTIKFEGVQKRPKKFEVTQHTWVTRYIGMTPASITTYFRRGKISQIEKTHTSHHGRIISYLCIKDGENDSQPLTFKMRKYIILLEAKINRLAEEVVQEDFKKQISLVCFQDDIVPRRLLIRELKRFDEFPPI